MKRSEVRVLISDFFVILNCKQSNASSSLDILNYIKAKMNKTEKKGYIHYKGQLRPCQVFDDMLYYFDVQKNKWRLVIPENEAQSIMVKRYMEK